MPERRAEDRPASRTGSHLRARRRPRRGGRPPAGAASRRHEPLHADRRADRRCRADQDPHHALNTPVGEPDPDGRFGPVSRQPTAEDDEDRASGTRGSGQDSQDA